MAVASDPVQEARQWLVSRGRTDPEAAGLAPGGLEPQSQVASLLFAVPPPPAWQDQDHPHQDTPHLDNPHQDRELSDLHPDDLRGERSHHGVRHNGTARPRSVESERGRSLAGVDADADPEAVARQIVLRKLSAQARTRVELERALQAKNVPPAVATGVLDRMEELRLIDDAGFARDWVESRQGRRHLSKGALRRELHTKGVPKDEIEAALQGVGPAEELSAARALAAKKVRGMGGLDRAVRYRRLAGALGRRGFGSGVISQVLAEVVDLS